MYRATISSIAGGRVDAPRRSATPATGLPSIDPRACRRTPRWSTGRPPPARRQIAGMSSTRIQCSWMFCRSVMSAVSRPNSLRDARRSSRSWARSSWPPSMRTRSMKYSSSSSCGSSTAVRPPSMPGLALGVEAPPAEPAAQVGGVDRGEAAVRVDVLDPGPDVERVVVLLGPLVGVERLAVAERPLALAARPCAAGRRPRGRRPAPGCCRPPCRAFLPGSVGTRARGGHPARAAATSMSGEGRRVCAPETEIGRRQKPDRWRCARGRSRRGDEPRSGGNVQRSCR